MKLSLGKCAQGIFLLRKNIEDYLKDSVFPIFCVECGLEGVVWCHRCTSKNHYRPIIFYPPMDIGVSSIIAFFLYNELYPTGKLLRQWKYDHVRLVEDEWQKLMIKNSLQIIRWLQMFDKNQTIGLVSVPLHPRRLRERGFNQSEIITKIFSEICYKNNIKVEIITGLKRRRYTKQQAKLSIEKRAENLLGAFVWVEGILPRQIVLVDDVFTNGYTMGECAKVLREQGAEKIGGLVLAKG
ncbi:MAG: hypothetical protein Q7S24_01000 [bacterium]|nr:hypothetical protein [bacterium]